MVDITIELVRKRSEHNEGEISTLEELAMHQEDIKKIDNLQNWCRELKILLLQSNLISRIENVWKLKKLEYLNLALNNIEVIENLEGCESLKKLDLTLNFIGELTSVEKLRANIHLESLFLTGNPCCDYTSYRNYVIGALPELKTLDSIEIERSDRIKAMQIFDEAKDDVFVDQVIYRDKRRRDQKIKAEKGVTRLTEDDLQDPEKTRAFWEEESDNSPETRLELARLTRLQRESTNKNRESAQGVRRGAGGDTPVNYFWPDGRPRNINQTHLDFLLEEDEENNTLILEVAVYRFLDTTLIDVNVEPTFVRVLVKGKTLQLVLPEEVHPDKSKAERSQTTGHLLVTMPMVKEPSKKKTPLKSRSTTTASADIKAAKPVTSKRELLEIGPADPEMDFSRICEMARTATANSSTSAHASGGKKPYTRPVEKEPSREFKEDPQVPPLE